MILQDHLRQHLHHAKQKKWHTSFQDHLTGHVSITAKRTKGWGTSYLQLQWRWQLCHQNVVGCSDSTLLFPFLKDREERLAKRFTEKVVVVVGTKRLSLGWRIGQAKRKTRSACSRQLGPNSEATNFGTCNFRKPGINKRNFASAGGSVRPTFPVSSWDG